MANIGTLGGGESDVTAVNEEGLVVGGSWTAGNVAWRAFAWTRKTGIIELRPANGSAGTATPPL